MKSIAWIPALVVALTGWAPDASAHGGQYRVPGGGLPPGLREPFDPPPAPPPPTPQPPVTDPPSDDPDTPPVTPPVTPPAPPVTAPTGAPGTNPTRRGPTLDYTSWIFWYAQNGPQIENVKESIYALRSSGSALGILGAGTSNRSAATHDIRSKIESHIIPTLLTIIDPKAPIDADLESAAYLALAKVTSEPQHVDLILKGMHPKNPKLVKEAAAFACGMLRRAERSRQLAPNDLDRVRDKLFTMFADDRFAPRERGFALLGVGLLGDQPSATGADKVTERLFSLLREDHQHNDLVTAILQAISMQPERAVTESQRQVLRDGVLKGRIYDRRVKDLTTAHCAQALGRIGSAADVLPLARALTSRRTQSVTQRSAAIALGSLASRISAKDRVLAAKVLAKRVRSRGGLDTSAGNFARISLARLVVADHAAGRTDVMTQTRAVDDLLKAATHGRFGERDFAALALGLINREIDPDRVESETYGEFRLKSVATLRKAMESRKLDPRSRAAFVTALGLARDERSRGRFTELLADRRVDAELRGYCANALGLIGVPSPDVLRTIRRALKERRTEELRIRTARALGMLRDLDAVPLLVSELRHATSMAVKGQVVIALANVGDGRAVQPLVDLVKDENEQDLTRAQACAGLGILGDLEWNPSLQRLRHDLNYRAMSNLLWEAVSIL